MSLAPSFDTKEQVRQAVDIVELVGQSIPLRRQGRNYVGICPWHDDSRPSLQVNPDRQTFKCWVCDIGGDVFSFTMKREGVSFPEALRMLAERGGIQLQPQSGPGGPPAETKQKLFEAAAWAERRYHNCLVQEAVAEPARRYLIDRGISQESIERFRIGFAPNQWQWLLDHAKNSPFSPSDLTKVGLARVSERTGRHYDFFRGRVLFSIRDVQERPIALGGRVLPGVTDENTGKYINSPETALYVKSNTLYSLDAARDTVQKTRHAVVVEGFTDVIMAHQFGITNAVAVCGTALGERHVQLLNRYADRITLVLDGDEAGQGRTNEVLDLFVAGQVDLRILTLPEGTDPCDFILQNGKGAFETALDAAPDALQHKLRVSLRGIDPGSGKHEANRALEDVLTTLSKAPRLAAGAASAMRLREDQFLARLAREFRVDESMLRRRVADMRRFARRGPATISGTDETERKVLAISDPWEQELIEILIQEPEAISRVTESLAPEQLNDPVARQILEQCCRLSAAGQTLSFDRLLLETDDPDLKALLVRLDERGQDRGGSDLVQQLPDMLASFRRRREALAHRATAAALKERQFDESDEVQILNQLLEQRRARQREIEPTG